MDEDLPQVIARVMQARDGADGRHQTYEEANWAKLSPHFRAAHNRLRQARGLSPIPEPKIDLYVPPNGPAAQPFDPRNMEFRRAVAEHYALREGAGLDRIGGQGFEIKGGFQDMSEAELRAINRDPRA